MLQNPNDVMVRSPHKVVVIGPYPSPVGGISVHVERLSVLLRRTHGAVVIDPYSKAGGDVPPWVRRVGPLSPKSVWSLGLAIRREQGEVVHFHVSSMKRFALAGWALLTMLPRKVRRIVTIHSGRFVGEYMASGALYRVVIRHLLRSFDGVIAVNSDIATLVESFGIPAKAIAVIPAFLPPPVPRPGEATQRMSALRRSARTLLAMSGYAQRDYSFETVVNAVKDDPRMRSRCGIVVCLYNYYDKQYLEELTELTSDMQNVIVLKDLSPEGFAEVLSACDIFVRPTRVDGDAVAVREAGHFLKQIVASDCVQRPAGSLVFRTGDQEHFREVLLAALKDSALGRIEDLGESTGRAIGDFYQSVMRGRCES